MVIGISYFGDKAFLPLVKAWWKIYLRSGCKYPVVITTDLTAVLPEEAVPYDAANPAPMSYLRFDTNKYPDIRRDGKAFDIQGALAIQAIQILPRCMIVDADAFFVKDPTPLIEQLPQVMFGMGIDPNVRRINGISEYIKEDNAGVLYYGTDSKQDREELAQLYRHTFQLILPQNNNTFLEQCAWSAIRHELLKTGRACTLPVSLNWSHVWKNAQRKPADAGIPYILHEHGPGKWNFIEGIERDVKTKKPANIYKSYYSK